MYEDCNVTDVEICNNGGSCRKLRPSYICECLDGFTGINCQTGTYLPLYMIIIKTPTKLVDAVCFKMHLLPCKITLRTCKRVEEG